MHRLSVSTAIALASLACGSEATTAEQAPAAAAVTRAREAEAPPEQAPAQEEESPAAGATEPLSLRAGFVPDPHVVEGVAGGETNAVTLSAQCTGYVRAEPNHELEAGDYFTELRVFARGEEDLTLVIERPDGSFVCDDDAEDTHPMVATNFPPGRYRIWVGAGQLGRTGAYRLGFSERPTATPALLAQ